MQGKDLLFIRDREEPVDLKEVAKVSEAARSVGLADNDFGQSLDIWEGPAGAESLNPLPRSVVRPTAFQLLDGEWRFELDWYDRGLDEKWFLGHDYTRAAVWPGSVEAHMAGTGDESSANWQDIIVAWYERDFVIPEGWRHSPRTNVQVSFGACGYETRVWLNGRALRTVEGEEVHYGEYTSFSFELPPEHLLLVNRLTVRIASSMDAEIPRGKQQSHVYKRGGVWYQTYTGAVRSVWLETVERNRLRSRVNVLSSHRDRFVSFDLTMYVHDPGAYVLRLVVRDSRGAGDPLAMMEYRLPLNVGNTRQRVRVELPEARLWSPAEPNLYHLVAQLIGPDGAVSQIGTRFGLRQIEARGRFVYLNDQPVYLDGILYQPGTATYEEMRRHMRAMKELGCNLVRVHVVGIDPRIYDLADEMGMLLWVEVPSPHSSSRRSRENHRAEMMRMLVHVGSHPSVVIWSLYHEGIGAQDVATDAETRRYLADAYDYMRLNHPQFLVVENDGWNHVSVEGRLKSDLLTAHIYTPDIERWRELLDRLAQGQQEGVTVEPLVVGDPFFYVGDVPLVVSEWGGFQFPSGGRTEEAAGQAEQIMLFKRELRRRPIAGDVYTQATSVEEGANGLIDPQTGELFVPPGILSAAE